MDQRDIDAARVRFRGRSVRTGFLIGCALLAMALLGCSENTSTRPRDIEGQVLGDRGGGQGGEHNKSGSVKSYN